MALLVTSFFFPTNFVIFRLVIFFFGLQFYFIFPLVPLSSVFLLFIYVFMYLDAYLVYFAILCMRETMSSFLYELHGTFPILTLVPLLF
jgi:hypothetical protein